MFKFGFHIIQLIIKVLLQFNTSRKETLELIKQLESKHQGRFTPSAIQKACKFQGVQQLLINDAFANLIDRDTNEFERTSNKLYFILTGLYDDIIDQKILSTEELDELFSNPLNNSSTLFEVKALVDVHLQLIKRTKFPDQYKSTLAKIHQAQKDSIQQFNSQIDPTNVLDITLRKGGYSLLMCRHYIDLPNAEQMDQCWYQLGGIIQFTNDLYDIYKDLQEGIFTYPNTSTNFKDLNASFEQLTNDLKKTIDTLPFSKSQKDKLLIQLSIIPAFGYIALENLSKLQNNHGNLPKLSEVERKDLIIDMEKTTNRFKLIRHAYHIAKSN
jgi:hypothetical protein